MDTKHGNVDKSIYNICSMIHNLVKLDVEFLDKSHSFSLKLFNSKMPFTMQPFRSEPTLHIDNILVNKSSNDYLFHIDNFQLNYLGVGLWQDKSYKGTLIVGPFLSDIPDDGFISKVIEVNKLPLGYRLEFQQYYRSLQILDSSTSKNIGSLIVNLAINPIIDANALFSEKKYLGVDNKEKNEFESEKFYTEVELRYKLQREIQNAVEKGSKEELKGLLSAFYFNPTHRVPNNPLRAQKNLAFSFNTILRLAAERGDVSPVYLHNTSDKFAVLIETVSNMVELENLMSKAALEYCDLVNKLSTAGCSPAIRKAIDYINLNFSEMLCLNTISEKIGLSPSHLSRQFKKETNSTITEFINKKRVEEAKFLIKQNNHSITDIALMVGFESHNYFCTVFKQITSLTPKEHLGKSSVKK